MPADRPYPAFPAGIVLGPEFRLAVACSWLAPEAHAERQAATVSALLDGGIDWSAFLRLVTRHRIPALAWAVLSRYAHVRPPEETLRELQRRGLACRRQALRYAAELSRVTALLNQAGIESLVLKGPPLAQELYGDQGLRHSKDLDLLIRPADLERADSILRSGGYAPLGDWDRYTPRQQRHFMAVRYHHEYQHTQSRLQLELHWNSQVWAQTDAAGLWSGSRRLDWQGSELRIPAGDALLRYVCEHGCGHLWFRLKWLGDAAALLAGRTGPGGLPAPLPDRMLGLTALLTHWLYGLPLPATLRLDMAGERALVRLSRPVLAAMRSETEPGAGNDRGRMTDLRSKWHLRRLKPSVSLRAYLAQFCISVHDFEVVSLPDGLFWLYAPLRPFLWGWRNWLRR